MSTFFTDQSDVFERLVTFVDPLLFVGDANVYMERPTNAVTSQMVDLLNCHGFANCVTAATNDLGGSLDIIAARANQSPLTVDVLDAGLSDHRPLRWSTSLFVPVRSTAWYPDIRGSI